MKFPIQVASTSVTVNIFVRSSASTTGAGLTGLVFNTASLTAYYMLPAAVATLITLATQTVTGAFSSGGFVEIDATHCPGWYRLDIPNAALASGRFVDLHLQGAANMAPLPFEIELTAWNDQDAVHGGMTALPNAAAGAVGGLPLSVDTSGRVDVLKINGTSQTARDLGATLGVAGAGLTALGDTRIANLDAAISTRTKPADTQAAVTLVTTLTTYTGNTPQTGDGFARIGAPAGLSVSVDVAAVKADTAAVKAQTDKLAFTVANQVDSNVIDWKGAAAPAMTGDAFARLGAAGAGLTALGDTRIANLDAAISTRTKPADTQAAVTLVGTVTTYTGNTPQTGDAFARLGAPAGASVSADVAAVKTDLDAGVLVSSAGADAILDRANGVETGVTLRQAQRLKLAALAGKLSGAATTTITIRDINDTANRIVATVDANGNRSALTYID